MTCYNSCPSGGTKMRVRRKAISPKWRLECRCGTSGPWAAAPDQAINFMPPMHTVIFDDVSRITHSDYMKFWNK